MFYLPKLGYRYYAIFFAVILKVFFLSYDSVQDISNIHPDARSAIERAKTEGCRNELTRVALTLLDKTSASIRSLKSSCPYDSQETKTIQQVGCITDSNKLLRLDYPHEVQNVTLCWNLCFAYGHRYGGLNETDNKCYCGDEYESHWAIASEDCLGQFKWYRVNDEITNALSVNKLSHSSSSVSSRPITIAFVLSLNGRSLLQIRRLLKLIYRKRHLYYVHIDRRRDHLYREMLPLQQKYDNVIVTQSRFSTIWGGPALLRMILNSIQEISNRNWDFIINLSESDFPLKGIDDLETYLQNHEGGIFLRTHNMKGYKFIKKQGLDRTFYQCDDHVWRLGERILPQGIIYSGGSDWFALPRYFCNYIINSVAEDSSENLVAALYDIFNKTLLPAESFFHTIALNSEFCDKFQDDNLRLTNWQRKQGCKCQHKNVVDWCGCSPMVYRSNDWTRLEQTKHFKNLFLARKFDPTICISIINKVENELISEVQSTQRSIDTRYWQNVYHVDDQDGEIRDQGKQTFEEFGRLALRSIWIASPPNNTKLRTVDLYFNQDQFIGYIVEYCNGYNQCLQLLLERNTENRLSEIDENCLKSGERTLQVIEVGQGFDTSERVFRDLSPLNPNSDIIVYHEWLVQVSANKSSSREKIRFSWLNPKNQIRSIQNAKLKMSSKLTRLSLAHRLNTTQPLDTGCWTLLLSHGNKRCFAYQFLVLGSNGATNLNDFKKFFTVTKIWDSRFEEQSDPSEWTLNSKRDILATYDLKMDE